MSNKRRFRKYNGLDKYHCRIYQRLHHPFIVATVDYNYKTISGYVITTSPTHKKSYYRLFQNPNPNDSKLSYITRYRITDRWHMFSKPFNNWHLSPNDVKLIDWFEKEKQKAK
ncbi:MAG: hypothetical protein MJ208_02570 [Bacilli bacterium]|nr:hypothetical protein [Bacilli bacterium]